FSSRRRHTRSDRDWSSDVCSSDLEKYKDDQKEIESEAHKLEQEVALEQKRADRFDLGEVFLEIALVVSSITLLSGKRMFWQLGRSEERRVGKECGCRWWTDV